MSFDRGVYVMHHPRFAAVAVAFFSVIARAGDEPKLVDTTERLTADEEKTARLAVYDNGPTTASRDIQTRPYPRILVVPKELESLYKDKPKATVRLLLKIVDGGRAWDSIHAVCCIEALVESPEFGAISAQGANAKKWDDVIGEANPLTRREHSRQVCLKLIVKKEKDAAPKGK
jgi:hypothetical protein